MTYSPGTLLQVAGIASGAAAFVLPVLAWEFFRGSPFGDLVAFLPVLVAAFTGLGVLSVAVPAASQVFELAEAVVYTWLLVIPRSDPLVGVEIGFEVARESKRLPRRRTFETQPGRLARSRCTHARPTAVLAA